MWALFLALKARLSGFFSSKGRYMTSKIKFLSHILALREGHFDYCHLRLNGGGGVFVYGGRGGLVEGESSISFGVPRMP